MQSKKQPKTLIEFQKKFPDIWRTYANFRDSCDDYGSLDPKTRELIKIGIEVALQKHGGLIAHIHRAQKAGASRQDVLHAILLATPLVGLPIVLDAFRIASEES